MPDNVDYNLWNLDAKNTILYMGMTMALTPFSDDIFVLSLALMFQMINLKHFNMQGIKKLDRLNTNSLSMYKRVKTHAFY